MQTDFIISTSRENIQIYNKSLVKPTPESVCPREKNIQMKFERSQRSMIVVYRLCSLKSNTGMNFFLKKI